MDRLCPFRIVCNPSESEAMNPYNSGKLYTAWEGRNECSAFHCESGSFKGDARQRIGHFQFHMTTAFPQPFLPHT